VQFLATFAASFPAPFPMPSNDSRIFAVRPEARSPALTGRQHLADDGGVDRRQVCDAEAPRAAPTHEEHEDTKKRSKRKAMS